MAGILDKVKTIVLVMFENRSFDHILGHLSHENINPDVDGLRPDLSAFKNIYKGDVYPAYPMANDTPLPYDLPHEYTDIKVQMARSNVTGRFTMSGFVEAFADATGIVPNPQSLPMGFFKSQQVQVTSFLANTFCTCDRWFAPFPSSTQPNKTMAFFGDSAINSTETGLINMTGSIFDWLNDAGVRWRVYHDGISFFILYPHLWNHVLGRNFRDYEFLSRDMQTEAEDEAPEVIIVEPSYQDAPHIGSDRPNDNHAPLAMGWGEEFLRRTYEAVTSNKKRWENTVMVVYYDEHGGFYDHVSPPAVHYTTVGSNPYVFESLGPRVPAIIASPLVSSGTVCHSVFDHTSVLQLLAEKFTPGTPYSAAVHDRKLQGVESVSKALTNDILWTAPPPPSVPITVQTALGQTIKVGPETAMAESFENAANELIGQHPVQTGEKYPELFQWKDGVKNARQSE